MSLQANYYSESGIFIMVKRFQENDQPRSTGSQKKLSSIGRNLLKIITISSCAVLIGLVIVPKADAIEEIPYRVVNKQDNFELRQYSSYLLAETEVKSSFDAAANQAFRNLFRYISGDNQSNIVQNNQGEEIAMTAPVLQQEKGEEIAMTAPVLQQEKGEEIAMTAPVLQQADGVVSDTYLVSFVVPKQYTLETVPVPKNSKVKIRKVPAKLMASISYSGWWSQENYQKHKGMLYQKTKENGYQIVGKPLYARYNAPFTPWFLRRNEIIVNVEKK